MTIDVTDRLAALGETLRGATAPITPDDARAQATAWSEVLIEQASAEQEHVVLTLVDRPQRRRRTPLVGVAAAAVVILGLTVLVPSRPDDGANAVLPTAPLSADGRLTIADPPDGWTLAGVIDFTDNGSDPVFVSRIYAADAERPDIGPALEVQSYMSIAASPAIPSDAASIDVGGASGKRYVDEQGRTTLAFERDDRWYVLIAQQITDEQLQGAAEHTRGGADGDGAVVDPAGLPRGLGEIASGFHSAFWLRPSSTASASNPTVGWRLGTIPDNRFITATSVPGTDLMSAQRLWADQVDEIEIRGVPALAITKSGAVGIVWYEHGRTWFVSGYQADANVVRTFAEALSGADPADWSAMKAAVAPPAATSANGVPAQPGSLVASGTTLFPRIDGDLVNDVGRGPTYAYYSYDPAGIETAGSSWSGTLRRTAPDGTIDHVNITVTTAESAMPRPPTTPGRIAGVEEWNFGAGADLYATIGGYDVTVEGTYIDLLYDVLAAIEPTAVDGQLSGYRFPNGLPDGLVESATPFGRNPRTGAFPTVSIHNGGLTMRIDPAPIANTLGTMPQLTATDATPLGTAHFDPDTDFPLVVIELTNGTTLQLSSQDLDIDQVLALVPSIQLVDEAAWQTEYHPRLAIVPFIDTANTTMIESAASEPPDEQAPATAP